MSLLRKASIVTTPTSYENGKILSVKPVPSLGSELVTNGDFATDSDWTLGTGWTISGGAANQDGSNGILRQSNVAPLNTKFKVTFDLTNYNGNGGLTIKLAPTQYDVTLNGNGTYNIFTDGTNTLNDSLQIISSNGFVGSIDNVSVKEVLDADFDFTRNSSATRVNSQGLIEDITSNLPRIDYTGGEGHWLFEPQSTNTATYSNDFTQGDIFVSSADPSVQEVVLTSQQSISPDGTNNAWKLVDNNDGLTGQAALNYYATTVIANNYNTISYFVKKQGSNNFVFIAINGLDAGANGNTWFNIQNGTLGNVSANHTANIQNYGNGWYRISITMQTTTDVVGAFVLRLATSNGTGNILRDGTNGVYLFGVQAESDASRQFMTSYIPTNGSQITRLADAALGAGSSDLINSTEGVLYAEIAKLDVTGLEGGIRLSKDTNNEIRLNFAPNNRINVFVNVGGVNQAYIDNSTFNLENYNKIAIKYKLNDYVLFINGNKVHTDTNTLVPANMSELKFNNFFGRTKCVAVFKEALTDAELTCLTTI